MCALGDVNCPGVQVLGSIGERVFPQYFMSDGLEGDSLRQYLRCARGGSDRSSFVCLWPAGIFATSDSHSQPLVWRNGLGLVLPVCEPGFRGRALHDTGLA